MRKPFDDEDIEIIMSLARQLTGTKVSSQSHAVIFQNVAGRIQELKLEGLEEYLSYVDANDDEMQYLISAVTIHTTGWFRELGAFEKLEGILAERAQAGKGTGPFKLLSVACSTGEEVYSFAALLDAFKTKHPGFEFSIEGWDIDPISLRSARSANYDLRALEKITAKYKNYLNATIEQLNDKFIVTPWIKDRCRFRSVNILQPPQDLEKFDFVLCRNMLIYFEPSDVAKIVADLANRTVAGGHVCVGVSETSGMHIAGVKPIGQAVYQKTGELSGSVNRKHPSISVASAPKPVVVNSAKILVVEDESELRSLMLETLEEAGFDVTGAAHAQAALDCLERSSYGLIISDLRMPGKTGLELCQLARASGCAAPFVIVSGLANRGVTEQALAMGCSEVILKPFEFDDLTRLARRYIKPSSSTEKRKLSLILLGASTGGTEVLAKLLAKMPANTPPLMVVQHIAAPFARDFAERLVRVSGLKLGRIESNAVIEPGHIYIPLGDYHIGVKGGGDTLKLIVSHDPPICSHRPSVDFLFSSASKLKQRLAAALLTGMGRDGAKGLLELRQQGATTFAQNEATCAVYGMPKEAVKLNAAQHICSPEDIRSQIERLITV